MPSCLPLSLCLFPPYSSLTILHTWQTSWCYVGDPQREWNVPRECEGCTNVSYTNLPNSPWPPSRHVFNSLGPEVSGDAVRCCLVSQGTLEQATDISAGHKPGSVSRWKKPGHRANVPSSGGGLGIPRSNQAIHQKGYFCTF